MNHFLSCDWGTSSFRLKLVETETLHVQADLQNNNGISSTNVNWQKEGNERERLQFFASVIASAIVDLENRIGKTLSGVPVILSGMASSSLGMIQLPYKQLPFKTDGSDLTMEHIKPSKNFDHDMFVISGACSEVDVMRGEETQLVGAAELHSTTETLYIFPGTHSKHISVRDGMAYDFKTYITGELFSLLSKNSTLTEAVSDPSDVSSDINIEAFVAGVKESVNSNLLHQLFRVRTRFLLDKLGREHNRSYLSGLLVGNEVRDLSQWTTGEIVVVSSYMGDHYKIAMQAMKVETPLTVLSDGDVAVRGQWRIVSHSI